MAEEPTSGTSDASARTGLNRVRELVEAGKVKKVLGHEVSRIARRNSVAHEFLEFLDSHAASLDWHSPGIETLPVNGKRNPAPSIIFSLLSEMARAERETMVERINSGLAEARRKGVKLGRPKGATTSPRELIERHRDIVKQLRAGQSVRNTAAITRKGISTVQRVKSLLGASDPINSASLPHGFV